MDAVLLQTNVVLSEKEQRHVLERQSHKIVLETTTISVVASVYEFLSFSYLHPPSSSY